MHPRENNGGLRQRHHDITQNTFTLTNATHNSYLPEHGNYFSWPWIEDP